MSDYFVVPPYSILDARQGYWNKRKRELKEELGFYGESREGVLGESNLISQINNGVSLFDLVLLEIIGKWFGLKDGKAIDPMCGGYEKPYILNKKGGMSHTGIELRKEQFDVNTEKIKEFGLNAVCINDDGRNVLTHISPDTQDLFFCCPPYFNLEVYSDLEDDLSNQKDYNTFLTLLDEIFSQTIKTLKDNRFAVIVVGDVRTKKGGYYRFPDHVKDIFERNNMVLYNEIVLIESGGTLALRVGQSMKNRKVGKCHQSVLVFYKGDTGKIKDIYPNLLEYEDVDNQTEVSKKMQNKDAKTVLISVKSLMQLFHPCTEDFYT